MSACGIGSSAGTGRTNFLTAGAALLLVLWARAASAGMLSASGVAVLDNSLSQRPSFSNNEKIVLQQQVYNGVASPNRVQFQFTVQGPSHEPLLVHHGNSVPGTVGKSASQLAGIQISSFYRGPGQYTLQATASLDGQTVTQTVVFVISTPNILLIYPPNGARSVAGRLTFFWSSSGASQYRVTVGDSPSFYNSVFNQTTIGGETSLSYPENPADQRQRLAADPQVYYWKVEGLDQGGALLGKSDVPYSFTLAAAGLTKDLAVTGLVVDPAAATEDGSLGFVISVKNQGGMAQADVPLKFSVGGLAAAGTPIALPMLAPEEGRDFKVSEALPEDQEQSLAVACVEFSDDNIANNCRTLLVTQSSTAKRKVKQAILQLIRGYPGCEDAEDLDESEWSVDELRSLLAEIKSNPAILGCYLLPGSQAASEAAEEESARQPEAPPAPVAGGFEEEVREWRGMHEPIYPQTRAFTVGTKAEWRRLWQRLSDAPLPDVDFKEYMVLAAVAGRGDRADSIEFEGLTEMGGAEVLARYRLVVQRRMLEPEGPQRAASRTTVPYLLRQVPRAELPVRFERMEE